MRNTLNVRSMHRSLLMWLLLFAGPTASAFTPKVQCVLVENAQIARQRVAEEGEFGRANYGHQIVAGARSVLAVRVYEDRDEGPDSQLFKKATLETELPPDIAAGEEVTVNVLRSYYAQGASAWVEQGRYWWATDSFPHVHFRRDSSGLHATLKANVDATFASKVFPRPRRSIQVDVECPVRRQAVMELSQWVGRVGTNMHSFYDLE